jgi:hypothetical protein
MPILESGQGIKVIRLSVSLDQFPILLASHVAAPKKIATAEVEKIAAEYVANDFQTRATMPLVKAVCDWGNYAGVAGKVSRYNRKKEKIAETFKECYRLVTGGNPESAIQKIIDLKGLRVSFGSKHLKFLAPDHAVVLDSIISEYLGYPLTKEGYAEFLQDCFVLRDILNTKGIRPSATQTKWRVSDVEMALYMEVKKRVPPKPERTRKKNKT